MFLICSSRTKLIEVYKIIYFNEGTTWMQQIVWLMCNNADTNVNKDKPLSSRIPFLETVDMTDKVLLGIQTLEKWQKNKQSSGNIRFGSWFPHVLKYWEKFQTDKERIYFTTYEAMKKDMKKEIVAVANFLGKKQTNEQIDIISNLCTFDSMSKDKGTNYSHSKNLGMDFKKSKVMRKGEVGDWKNYFTINENAAFDELYEEKIKDSGLDIPFEL
ncbi:sulfotransferase 1E1-like [Styela clava]